MGKLIFGFILLVVAVMASFIPPFFFGIPIGLAAFGLIAAGFAKITGQAVKGGVKAAKYINEKSQAKDRDEEQRRQASGNA